MKNRIRALFDKMKALLADQERLRELALYVVFGVATTAVNWGVYIALTSIFGLPGLDAGTWRHKAISNVSNITAWILGVLFAYITNKKFVFKSNVGAGKGRWIEFFMFVSARVMSYVLFDFALFNISIYYMGMGDRCAKLLMNVIVVIFNYFASKYIVFGKKAGNR